MRQVLASTVGLAIAGAVVAGLAVLIGVDRTDLVLDGYLVFVGALVALAAARLAGRAFPTPRRIVPSVLAPTPRRYALPESLAIAEDEVALAQADQFNLHFRLRPVLAEIAGAGLATDAGIDLEHDERARERLSPETWELVRPGRPRPDSDDTGGGISTASLASVVSDLERILPA